MFTFDLKWCASFSLRSNLLESIRKTLHMRNIRYRVAFPPPPSRPGYEANPNLASSPGLQLCGGKAWYRLHALDFRILFRKIVRKCTGPQYPYVFGFCRFCRMLAHAHAVDTRPSLRIIEGLGTRLTLTLLRSTHMLLVLTKQRSHVHACGPACKQAMALAPDYRKRFYKVWYKKRL